MKPIAVLGSGPAALMAAWACLRSHRPFVILSKGEKSRLGGAQWLHRSIPDFNTKEPETIVSYILRGTSEQYQLKAYGRVLDVPSWGDISLPGEAAPERPAWSLVGTYARLWELFGPWVKANQMDLSARWLNDHLDDFDLVLSTVPAPSLCLARDGVIPEYHQFVGQSILVHPDTLEGIPEDTIIYDGTDSRTWYRSSRLFGVGGTEWNADSVLIAPVSPKYPDVKPISTNCTCWNETPVSNGVGVYRLGRRGTWDKSVHTHDAYFVARSILEVRYGS